MHAVPRGGRRGYERGVAVLSRRERAATNRASDVRMRHAHKQRALCETRTCVCVVCVSNTRLLRSCQNKATLARLLKYITEKDGPGLDTFLTASRSLLTPGFFAHLTAEMSRVSNAPSPSLSTLSLLQLIQTRCIEEIGASISPAATAVGDLVQLAAGDVANAVLAGLERQNDPRAFADELLDLVDTSLADFNTMRESKESGSDGMFGKVVIDKGLEKRLAYIRSVLFQERGKFPIDL